MAVQSKYYYKRYRASIYYIDKEMAEKASYDNPYMGSVRQLLDVKDIGDAITQGCAFAESHPGITEMCVVVSYYTKACKYNYRTDSRWYRWNGKTKLFEKEKFENDCHW